MILTSPESHLPQQDMTVIYSQHCLPSKCVLVALKVYSRLWHSSVECALIISFGLDIDEFGDSWDKQNARENHNISVLKDTLNNIVIIVL